MAKKTAKVNDKIKEAKTQLLHRYYVSLIYNSFQSLTDGVVLDDDGPYQVLSLDFPIVPNHRFHSWDIVLYKKLKDRDSVNLIFVEVKSASRNFSVVDYREKVRQTMELLTISIGDPFEIEVGGTYTDVNCVEFVIAGPPTEIGPLRNRFTQTTFVSPVILWGIDDGSKVHQTGKIAHIFIPYITETHIKKFPMCGEIRNEGSYPLKSDDEKRWYNSEIKRSLDNSGKPVLPQDNLTKNNDSDLLYFLSTPNVNSKSYVPGRIPMIDHIVNLAIVYLGGPLSGKGKDLAKADSEWIKEIDEFFRSFGLVGKNYGETYFNLLRCIGKFIQSSLSPNSYYMTKPNSSDFYKFIDTSTAKVLKCFESEHTEKIM